MEWDHREVAIDPENKKSIPKLSQVLDANTYDMQLYIYPSKEWMLTSSGSVVYLPNSLTCSHMKYPQYMEPAGCLWHG